MPENDHTETLVEDIATAPAFMAAAASSWSQTSPPAISGIGTACTTQEITLGMQPGMISMQWGFDSSASLATLW
jgi:hypothetical protein